MFFLRFESALPPIRRAGLPELADPATPGRASRLPAGCERICRRPPPRGAPAGGGSAAPGSSAGAAVIIFCSGAFSILAELAILFFVFCGLVITGPKSADREQGVPKITVVNHEPLRAPFPCARSTPLSTAPGRGGGAGPVVAGQSLPALYVELRAIRAVRCMRVPCAC